VKSPCAATNKAKFMINQHKIVVTEEHILLQWEDMAMLTKCPAMYCHSVAEVISFSGKRELL
jgi:hypothetical protein